MVGLSFSRPARGGTRRRARPSLLTSVFAVVLLTSSLLVLASLDHLVSHRELAGATWDAVVMPPAAQAGHGAAGALDTVRRVPGVAAATIGGWASSGSHYDGRVVVNGTPLEGQIFGDDGSIHPAIRRGRAPTAAGEVALGAKELDALDVRIGDAVTVGADVDGATIPGRVVGEVVLASPYFIAFAPGTGAATVASTYTTLGVPEAFALPNILVRYAAGADALRTFNSIESALGTAEAFEAADRQGTTGLDRIRVVPVLLIIGLLLLVAIALAHVLLVSVHGRRRDLATLSAIGFSRRQTWAAVVLHGTAIAVVVSLVGVPLGVVLGRLAWTWIADEFVVVARPIAPTVGLIGLLALLIVVAVAAALPPAARAISVLRFSHLPRQG
jgi:predicted lysophospholipase L1 biosynthesis ABC-type transport system permease subunit